VGRDKNKTLMEVENEQKREVERWWKWSFG